MQFDQTMKYPFISYDPRKLQELNYTELILSGELNGEINSTNAGALLFDLSLLQKERGEQYTDYS